MMIRGMLFLAASVAVLSCADGPTGTEERLPRPVLLPTPPDTSLTEEGIDAVDIGDYIQLDWRPGDKQLPAEYKIYRKQDGEEQDFILLGAVGGNQTTVIDSSDIAVGMRYYYYVTAVDDDGLESEPSDTLDYMLIAKADFLNNTLTAQPEFSWQVEAVPQFYILKLVEAETDTKIWVAQIQSSFRTDERVRFNADGRAAVDSLRKNVPYKWRVDIVGPSRNSGSESVWKRFVLQ